MVPRPERAKGMPGVRRPVLWETRRASGRGVARGGERVATQGLLYDKMVTVLIVAVMSAKPQAAEGQREAASGEEGKRPPCSPPLDSYNTIIRFAPSSTRSGQDLPLSPG